MVAERENKRLTEQIRKYLRRNLRKVAIILRGDEWSIKIFNCSQNFTFARFARKI